MKVYIGPNSSRLHNLFHWIEERLEWFLSEEKRQPSIEDGYNPITRFFDPVHKYIERYLDWKIPQTKIIHIDPWDTWSLDVTLAHIIAPALKQLKETAHGSAGVEDEDVPEHLRSTNAPPVKFEGDTDELWHERWAWVMDEMIFAFDNIINNEYDQSFYVEKDDGHYDIDLDGLKSLEERINNGTRLFGKYYRGLWD